MSVSSLRKQQPLVPNVEYIDVTPLIAEQWLGKMPRNRHLAVAEVNRYARDMTAGAWQDTGEAIKFDIDGNVLDGQHRLHAVVQSGKTIRFLIVRNLPPKAQDVMDTGRKRTAADALTMNGFPNAAIVAAAAKLAIAYERGEMRAAAQSAVPAVTHAEVLDFVDRNPDLLAAASPASGYASRMPMQGSVIAFCLFILRRIDAECAEEFFADLANMRTSGAGDPKYSLLRRLNNAKASGERISQVTICHYVFPTWNAMRAGESLSNMKTGNVHGAFAFTVPV